MSLSQAKGFMRMLSHKYRNIASLQQIE